MEVAVPRQEQSSQQTDDTLEFSRCSRTFRTSKRKAEEIVKYCNEKSEPKGKEETMGCLERCTSVGMEVPVAKQEQSNQHIGNNPQKTSKCSRAFGISKRRKVQENDKPDVTEPESEGKEDILVCSKRTTKLPFTKGDEPKKLIASNKNGQFEYDLLINNLEEDEEMQFLLKTKSTRRARRMDNTMVTIFFNAYFLHLKA